MKDARQEPFITVATLSKMNFPKLDWIVEGLLRTGLRRPSLLAAKPETGKSTLARQLAVAVSQGAPFLGRATTRSAVIYWQTEDEVQDVSSAFTRLGSKEGDENVHIFQGDPDSSSCEDIAEMLRRDEHIKLVIIETLDDLLKISDIKENTAAREAFDKFTTQLMMPFSHRASFLALHHMKKAETNFAGDGLLGASTIRGRTDAKIYLAQATPDDERRLIWSTKRVGRAIPKTFLVFDPATGKSELGETIADAKRNAEVEEKNAIQTKLFDILLSHPEGIEHKDLLTSLSGSSKNRTFLIREAVLGGSVTKSGRGVKASPFVYRMAEVPMEVSDVVSTDTKAEKENLNEVAAAPTVH
jgi:AAA domain